MSRMPAFRLFGIGHVKVPPDLAREKDGARAHLILLGYRSIMPRAPHEASRSLTVTFSATGTLAEAIAQHINAGDRLFIEAHLEADRWTDRVTGRRRVGVAFVLDEYCLLERRSPDASRSDSCSPAVCS